MPVVFDFPLHAEGQGVEEGERALVSRAARSREGLRAAVSRARSGGGRRNQAGSPGGRARLILIFPEKKHAVSNIFRIFAAGKRPPSPDIRAERAETMKQNKQKTMMKKRMMVWLAATAMSLASGWGQTAKLTAGQNVSKVGVTEAGAGATESVTSVAAAGTELDVPSGAKVRIKAGLATAGMMPRLKLTKTAGETVQVTGVAVNTVFGGLDLRTGFAYQMTATVTPSDPTDKTLTWSVSDTYRAAINAETGILVAKKGGPVNIRATANNGVGGGRFFYIYGSSGSENLLVYTSKGHIIDDGQQVELKACDDGGNFFDDSKLEWTISEGAERAYISDINKLTPNVDGDVTVRCEYYADGIRGGEPTYSNTVTFTISNAQGTAVDNPGQGSGTEIAPGTVIIKGIIVRSRSGGEEFPINTKVEMEATVICEGGPSPGVTWSVENLSNESVPSSSIDADTGELTTGNVSETIRVTATAKDGSGIFGSRIIDVRAN